MLNITDLVASLGLPSIIDVIAHPDDGLAFLREAFTTTKALGAVALTGVTYGSIGKITGQPPNQAEQDGTARFIEKAAALAAEYDLRLGIEPCNRYETHLMNTAQQAVDYIERVEADNLFIHLDTYHMHIEETSYHLAFTQAAPYLDYVHLSESNRGIPGCGMIDWDQVMGALKTIDYKSSLTLESMNHVAQDIASGLAIWRPVVDMPDDVIDEGLPYIVTATHNAVLDLDIS
ncbi:MAG: sugar phosphate isomerase/epimerase family protein [Pseudomonadota bacterium]